MEHADITLAVRSFNKLHVNIQNYYIDAASCHRILHCTCAAAWPLYIWSKPSININCATLYCMLNAQLFLHQWHIPHREQSLPQQWKPGPEVTGCHGNWGVWPTHSITHSLTLICTCKERFHIITKCITYSHPKLPDQWLLTTHIHKGMWIYSQNASWKGIIKKSTRFSFI